MKERKVMMARESSDNKSTNAAMKKHRKVNVRRCAAALLALVVLVFTTYTMILPAITMEQQLHCGKEEHVHTDECYKTLLVCGLEETQEHTHTDECFTKQSSLVCGLEEMQGHTHSDECFIKEQSLVCNAEQSPEHTHSEECYVQEEKCVCGLEETQGHTHDEACYRMDNETVCTVSEEETAHEHTDECYAKELICGREEHTHELMCYSDRDADVETAQVWERSVSDVKLSGIWADDLLAIAESQLGYKESKNNYAVQEDGSICGYTRYGAWYADPYGKWSAMFISFCLNYARIPDEDMPYGSDCGRWMEILSELGMYEDAKESTPQKGDIIFLDFEENKDYCAGIVSEIITDPKGQPEKIKVIMGDLDDAVKEKQLEYDNSHIKGHAKLPKNPDMLAKEQVQAARVPAETDILELTPDELIELLTQITLEELAQQLGEISPEELQTYLDNLSDDEMDKLMDSVPEEVLMALSVFLAGGQNLLAAGDLYVGFSKTYSTGAIDFANGGNGGGVRKYYLVKKSIYDQYARTGTYASQQSLIEQSEVAYCYNYYSTTPNTGFSTPRAEYDEKENASASLFYSSTSSHRRYTSQTQLYNKILAVAMNGYPNDYSGIGAKYGLSADEFRFITQYAVWYYTDSISVNFVTLNGLPYYYMYADDTHTWLTVSDGIAGYYRYYNPNIKLAYNELISSTLDAAAVNTSHINLYQKNSGSYQNLLTVGMEIEPPPLQQQNRLTLMKTVSGSAGNTEQEFHFTISLRNNNWSALTGRYAVTADSLEGIAAPSTTSINFDSNGTATVTLKHGQRIAIEGLPDGFYYSISEAEWNQDGYTSSVTEGSSSNMQTGGGGQGTVDVIVDNHKDAAPTVTKVQIPARKIIDGGNTPIGDNRFRFRLTGNGQDLIAVSDENGDVLFPEIIFTEPGTYTYTIEEIPDERDGVTFDFDKGKKTVTVTVSSHDVQTYDENAVYYAFEELDRSDFEYYYYVDTVPGRKGIIMYCTYQGVSGPQDPSDVSVSSQTYRVVINPSLADITANGWVQNNIYGADLVDNLKKLFYYFETADSEKISNGDKQSLVWSATGKTSSISSVSVNGRPASTNVTTVLNNIYATVTPPPYYNLAFFVPTGTQANKYPQPLATGYGAVVEDSVSEAVFDNTSKVQNSLKLGKIVSGTAGDKQAQFTFTVSLKDKDLKAVTGEFSVVPGSVEGVEAPDMTSVQFNSAGTATVYLKHGQNITIEGLPDEFYYSISEAQWNQNGYTSSVTKGSSSNLQNSAGAKGAVETEFTNSKEAPPTPHTYTAEIEATKTLDGETPADGQFTFILKNDQGIEIERKKNDADGKVIFNLTLPEPGTYTYHIEELNDGQEGIVYDTEVKTVTVTVGSEQLQTVIDGSSFVGTNDSDDFYITVNGTTTLDVYCIDGSAGYPSGNYAKVINPSTSQFEGQVTANYYSSALAENMRKLLYYFDTHSYTDMIGYTTLSKVMRQELIWCLTGNSGQQHYSYTSVLNTILNESDPPDNYTVVMFASTSTPKKQPVIAGYLPVSEVVYTSRSGTAEFANYHSYSLPETGGKGTTIYAIGGLLLMGGALILMYKTRSVRRKGEKS